MIALFKLAGALAFLFLASFATANAQGKKQALLTADRLVFTSGYNTLNASGNVIIQFGTTRLEAQSIHYDRYNNTIRAEGPLQLTDGERVTVLASFAELTGDLKQGVLKSARIVLDSQMQLSAVKFVRKDGRYNQLFKAATSTCSVSVAEPTPLWQIRATRIIHDEELRQIFFESAQLRIGKVSIAYLPRLRVPDPRVKRANGFLVPEVVSSSYLGAGFNAPYFITLGDYADVTLTPYIYSSGIATLGFDFRRRFVSGALDATGSISRDPLSANLWRGYILATGNFKLGNGLRSDMQLELVSDSTYLSNHGVDSKQRLESYIQLSRTERQSYFGAELAGFHSVSTAISNTTIPWAITDATMRRRWQPAMLGGQLGFSLSTSGFVRRDTTDITGRDGVRVSAVTDWRRDWINGSGVIFSTQAEIHGDRYSYSQDTTNPTAVTNVTPIAAAGFRLPMLRNSEKATEVLEPRIQLVWTPGNATTVPNEDSQLVEFEASNLFSLNRFPGIDVYESGARANVGITYSHRSTKGARLEGVVGQVFRLTDPGQFPMASSSSGTSSYLVFGGQLSLPSRLRLVQRMVFDTSFNIARNETGLFYKKGNFNMESSYLWLVSGAAGNTTTRSDWVVDGGIDLGNKWRTEASWRYDFINATTSEAAVALTYRNDCIKVDLSLSRQFASSSNVAPSTSLGLQVSLEGFGSRADSPAYNRKCADF